MPINSFIFPCHHKDRHIGFVPKGSNNLWDYLSDSRFHFEGLDVKPKLVMQIVFYLAPCLGPPMPYHDGRLGIAIIAPLN